MTESKRFPRNLWSYEACATPAIGSSLCPSSDVFRAGPQGAALGAPALGAAAPGAAGPGLGDEEH